MHEEVLTQNQRMLAEELFPSTEGLYLAGGTALALHIGHRRSLDFDLASRDPIKPFDLERRIINLGFRIQRTFTASGDEFSILLNDTRVTFFHFPFDIVPSVFWGLGKISLPEVPDLAAMKAYALGRRSKWKDYVDLYFLLKFSLPLDDLIKRAKGIFATHFNSKLFREQLCYFDDMDYSETVDYLVEAPDDQGIRDFLQAVAIAF